MPLSPVLHFPTDCTTQKSKAKGKTGVLLKTTGASFLFFSTIELYLQSRSTAFEKLEQKLQEKQEKLEQKHAEEAQFALRGDHDHDHDDEHKKKKKWAPRG